MSTDPTQDSRYKKMFLEFVAMLAATTMQHMGKTINPFTGKVEIHLDAAQATIDMLEMLEAKTRGNRDAEEERSLKNTLTNLRMNFVEVKATPPQPNPASAPPDAGASGTAEKEPRFHKSYG